MPIRCEHRFFYPIDWPQLSAVIRFRRAGGRCEACRRPHGQTVFHLGDGRWWDGEFGAWRDGHGKRVPVGSADDVLGRVRRTRVVLAAAHRDHDTSNNAGANLAAFCQRCHLIHDRPEHRRRRWLTLFRRKALGDCSADPMPEGTRQLRKLEDAAAAAPASALDHDDQRVEVTKASPL